MGVTHYQEDTDVPTTEITLTMLHNFISAPFDEISQPILEMFETVHMDCYATDGATKLPVWIVRGDITQSSWSFLTELMTRVPEARIVSLSIHPSPETVRRNATYLAAFPSV